MTYSVAMLWWLSIICSIASVFYGAYIKNEKEAAIFHIAAVVLAILCIVKAVF